MLTADPPIRKLVEHLYQCLGMGWTQESDEQKFYAEVAVKREQDTQELIAFLSNSFQIFADDVLDIQEQIDTCKDILVKIEKMRELRQVASVFIEDFCDLIYPEEWGKIYEILKYMQDYLDAVIHHCEHLREIDKKHGFTYETQKVNQACQQDVQNILDMAKRDARQASYKSEKQLRTELKQLQMEILEHS